MSHIAPRNLTILALTTALAAGPVAGAAPASSAHATPAAGRTASAISTGVLTAAPSALVHNGRAHVHLTAPGAGRLTLKIVHRGRTIGRRTLTLSTGGARTISVLLQRSALHELRSGNFSAGLRVTFVAADGTVQTRSFGLRLKRAPS
jgi:hypothetical protein